MAASHGLGACFLDERGAREGPRGVHRWRGAVGFSTAPAPPVTSDAEKERRRALTGGALGLVDAPRSKAAPGLGVSVGQRAESTAARAAEPAPQGGTWIDRALPRGARPFAYLARLDKPIGTWLLLWPGLWSIALAASAGGLPDVRLVGLFSAGAVLLRGAGCTVNDLLDRDIDAKVARTRTRPLAAGTLSPRAAVAFLGGQLALGLGILLQLNAFSQALGAASLLLVFSYPLMKRWTYWPQAFLGLTFNWGALLGWAAVHGSLDLSAVLPLYLGGVAWTLVYDTIYAHQDKEDDVAAGVKSTALLFGGNTKAWISVFGAAAIGGLAAAGYSASLGWPFYAGLAGAGGHLAWQVASLDIGSRADCHAKFVSNQSFGAIVMAAIMLGKLAS